MEEIMGKAFAGAIGAASGFAATQALTLAGVTVTSPAMGALFGASIILFPSLETLGVEIKPEQGSFIATITYIALQILVYSAIGIAATAFFGVHIAFGKALILTTAIISVTVIAAIAIKKIKQTMNNASTAQA